MSLTPAQQEVLDILVAHGPLADHVLVPITQHAGAMHQSSSSVRSRRAELTKLGKVTPVDQVKMPSGRFASIHQAV